MISVKKGCTYVAVSALLVASAAYLLPKYIQDEPSYFTRTADFIEHSNRQFGYSFRSPAADFIRVSALPNPDKLPILEWIERKYPALPVTVSCSGGMCFNSIVDEDESSVYVINNGNAILEMTTALQDPGLIADILASRRVLLRTEPVSFELDELAEPFNGMVYGNSVKGDAVDITSDQAANAMIRAIGERRGYTPRYIVEDATRLVALEGYPTRPQVAEAWTELSSAARQAGFPMQVMSAYRDQNQQVRIFRSEYAQAAPSFGGLGFSASEIVSDTGQNIVDEVLKTVAVPGYSKHHTGWTVDVTQVGYNLFSFGDTDAYRWMSDNDFLNARRFGFLPSYPKGGPSQGPEPEAWEYVYVGADYLNMN